MNAILPGGSLYPDPEQLRGVEALATTLAPDQAIWLSGYFAGLGQSLRESRGAPAFAPLPDDAPFAAPAPAVESRKLTILYASETGNGSDLAQQIAARAREAGLAVTAADLAGYKTRDLKDEQDLIIVTSTHGEGDPPEPAAGFFEFLQGRRAPKLEGLRFAVLGLGDSTYEVFCGAAKTLDARLAELGAERLHDRADCDVDYEAPAEAWAQAVVARLTAEAVATTPAVPAAPAPGDAAGSAWSKRNPFAAEILDNIPLTGRESSKETRHVELSLEGSGLVYEPGDALGVVPRNDPRLVENLIAAAGLAGSDTVAGKAGEVALGQALETDYEIGTLTPRFVEHWAKLSDAAPLHALLAADGRDDLAAFLRRNHVIDVIRDHPVKGLAAQDFVAGLRGLQPRLYSLASSLGAAPDEAHLAISVVRYDLRDEPRAGVASGLLAERIAVGETLPVYVQKNAHFRLPGDDATPIIMVGAGTGVAPYRAFLQEREARGAKGKSWLFFGERNFRADFLYQTEWQGFLKDGVLERMDVAFSRDQQEKIYVHHRMREHGAEIYQWLDSGAHLYVCGDSTSLAPDIHRALIDIVAAHGSMTPEKAEEHVRNLQRDGRYQKDVY